MKKKDRNKIKRTVTFLIVFAIGLTLLASWGVLRVRVESQSETPFEIPSNYIHITDSSIFENIKKSSGKSLILFTSNWCGSCVGMTDKLKSIASTYTNINIYLADIETYRSYSNSYNVAITPALVLLENNKFNTIQEIRPEILESTINEFSLLGI